VGQDARDVGDVVEKFTGDPRVPGVTPRSGVVIVGVGPPFNEMLNIARLADTTSLLPGGSSSHLSSLAVSKGRSPVHPSLDTRRSGGMGVAPEAEVDAVATRTSSASTIMRK